MGAVAGIDNRDNGRRRRDLTRRKLEPDQFQRLFALRRKADGKSMPAMDAHAATDFNRALREIDAQHKRLSRLVEELSDSAIKSSDGRPDLAKLREVIDYTERHFLFEESVMASGGYRAHERHAEAHAQLLADLARWRTTRQPSDATDLFRLVEWLWQWLLEHIDTEDSDLRDWLQYRAVAAA